MAVDRIVYYSVILFAFAAGVWQHRYLDKAARLFTYLLAVTLFVEISAFISTILFKNNMPIFHIFTVIELMLVTNYFLLSNKIRYTLKQLVVIDFLIATVAVTNVYLSEPLTSLNTNMLIIEGFCISVMALLSFYNILKNEDITQVLFHIHFWIWSLLLILWCGTFFYWGFYKVLSKAAWNNLQLIRQLHWCINVFVYLGIGVVFYFLPKRNKYAF